MEDRPKYEGLYWCRYGFKGGRQLCVFLGYGDAASYIVRKWRANSGRWTDSIFIRSSNLIGTATKADAQRLGAICPLPPESR